MLELHLRLGLMETDTCGIALNGDVLDTEVGHTPHLVEYQLRITAVGTELASLQQWGNGFFGNPERLALLVVGADAIHLLEVADIAGTNRLTTVHPQLTEVDGTTVEVGHVGYQQFPLSFPTRDGHTA